MWKFERNINYLWELLLPQCRPQLKSPVIYFTKSKRKGNNSSFFGSKKLFSFPILSHFYVSTSPSRVWVEEWLLMDRKSLLMGTKHWVETVMQINGKVRQMNLMLNFLYINHSVYCIWRVKCDFSPQRNHRNRNVNNSSWLLIWRSWQGTSFNFFRRWRALHSFVNIFLLREEEKMLSILNTGFDETGIISFPM